MGFPRRADITDRGRRWIPSGGKFGTVVYTYNQQNVQFYVTCNEYVGGPRVYPTFKVTDADSGNVTMYTANGSSVFPTHSFESANGGTMYCKLPGIVTGLGSRVQSINSLILKGGDKWSDLSGLDLDTNELAEITLYSWPNITSIDLHSNSQLTEIETFEWPAITTFWFYGTGVVTFNCAWEWPNLTTMNFAGCPNLSTLYTGNWNSCSTINFTGASSLEVVDTKEWPALEVFNATNSGITGTFTTQNWPNLTQLLFTNSQVYGGNITSINLRSGWTELEVLGLQRIGAISEINTHNTWTKLRTFHLGYTNAFSDVTFHDSWVLTSLSAKVCSGLADATVIDRWLEKLDAMGTSNGVADFYGSSYNAQSNRSASANTAITNLIGKGWTIQNV